MHIVNAMFGRGLGGIEQAFADYTGALLNENIEVTAITHPKARIKKALAAFGGKKEFSLESVTNYGLWDPFAVRRLRSILLDRKPDAVIAHGNRAAALLGRAAKNICPAIGVAHNYRLKRMIGLDAVIAISHDIRQKTVKAGQDESRAFYLPNMIVLPDPLPAPRAFHTPPVIGAMGRFVSKKGFGDLIKALALLRADGVNFQAIIGGDGVEAFSLRQLSHHLNLDERITFPGWIADKTEFFEAIDIFCLPSLHEPFGIVLLEAWKHGVPVITTDSEGPAEIVTPNTDAWVVPRQDIRAMAQALRRMIENPQRGQELARHALRTLRATYHERVVGKQLRQILEHILSGAT